MNDHLDLYEPERRSHKSLPHYYMDNHVPVGRRLWLSFIDAAMLIIIVLGLFVLLDH